MAYKIDHTVARIPPPSRLLFEKMAREGFDILSELGLFRQFHDGAPLHVPYEQLQETLKDALEAQARAMYGVIAQNGGGRTVPVAPQD